MNKVLQVTKIRFLMLIISLAVIAVGLVGTYFQGGFNWGIDFVGGYNQQIQFAPVAFSIENTGSGSIDITVQRGSILLTKNTGGTKEESAFIFSKYNTVADLINAVKTVEGISITVDPGYSGAVASRLLNKDYAIILNAGEAMNMNIGLVDEGEIFATKEKVENALDEFGRVYVQVAGSELDQKFIIKIHNEDAHQFVIAKDGPSVSADDTDMETEMQSALAEQDEIEQKISELLSANFESDAIIFQKINFIGSTFSQEIAEGAVWSLILALLLILAYISIRFKFNYAIAALSALVHDVAIMIGVIGLLQLEVTTTTFAAILTIVGYSLNDTIVVFDRVRENFTLMRDGDREMVINTSITQSLSRTIITSLTTLLAVVSIYIFGSGVIKDFAFNLIIGVVVGTYSSIFIASPIVLAWMNAQDRRKKDKQDVRSGRPKSSAKPAPSKMIDADDDTAAPEGSVQSTAAQGQRVQPKKKRKKK